MDARFSRFVLGAATILIALAITEEVGAQSLVGSGSHLPLPTGPEPLNQARTLAGGGGSFSGTWTAPALAAWRGTYTASGPIPSSTTNPAGIAVYDFSALPLGVLPAGTFFRFGDLDMGSGDDETFTFTANHLGGSPITQSWLEVPIYSTAISQNQLPGWSYTFDPGGSTYFFDGTTVPGNPNVAILLQTNTDIGSLEVTRADNSANFQLHAPVAPDPSTVAQCISKTAVNTYGVVANDIELVVKGVFTSVVSRSTGGFPDFDINLSGTSDTEFRWSGDDVPDGSQRTVSICLLRSQNLLGALTLLDSQWTQNGTEIGCARQVDTDWVVDAIVFTPLPCILGPPMFVTSLVVEFYDEGGGPPVHFSLSDSALRLPISSQSLPGTLTLNPGESAPFPTLPVVPPGTKYMLAIFDVDNDPGFTNATRDYVLINLSAVTVPALSPPGLVVGGFILGAAGAGVLISLRRGVWRKITG